MLEIKTVEILQGSQRVKWEGRIPDNYYCQVLHYLAVTEYEFAVLKAQLKRGTGQRPLEDPGRTDGTRVPDLG